MPLRICNTCIAEMHLIACFHTSFVYYLHLLSLRLFCKRRIILSSGHRMHSGSRPSTFLEITQLSYAFSVKVQSTTQLHLFDCHQWSCFQLLASSVSQRYSHCIVICLRARLNSMVIRYVMTTPNTYSST